MNPNALCLSQSGRPIYRIGDNGWKQFHAGDYSVSIEWLLDGRDCEPVMAIWSKRSADGGVFGICLSSIGKYADPSGAPTREAFIECWKALPTLGRAQIDLEVYALLDVVLRHTPDLIRCPAMPPSLRQAEAGQALLEVTTKDEHGKTLNESVI